MFKFFRPLSLVTVTLLAATSCMYSNCDEDCDLGFGEAKCMKHPQAECKCHETFRVKKDK